MNRHTTFHDAQAYLRQLGQIYRHFPQYVRQEVRHLDPYEQRTVAAEAVLSMLRAGQAASLAQIEVEFAS